MKSPVGYFRNIIEPTFAEHTSEPKDVRRAILACMVAYHYVDAVSQEIGEEPRNVYERLRDSCPSFEVVRAVCLAAKHIVAHSAGGITIDHIEARPPALWDEGDWDQTLWDDSKGAIVITGDAPRDVSAALREVVNYIAHDVHGEVPENAAEHAGPR